MGTWSIYVFGDLNSFWQALNGIAAYFGNTNFTSTAAKLGAFIALTSALFGFSTYSTDIGKVMRMVGTWAAAATMCFTNVNVQIENVYSNQVQAVNNVPAIVAIPASVFTTFGWNITQNLDTALQGTNGSYLTVSQNGIMQPLQIYMSLMNDSYAAKLDPFLYQNLTQIISDCSQGSTITRGASSSGNTLDTSMNILAYLASNIRQTGYTKTYNSANTGGALISCTDAMNIVTSGYNDFLNGSGGINNASALIKSGTGAKNNLANATPSINDYSTVFSSFSNGLAGLQQNAYQHAQNMLVSQTVDYTLSCLSESGQIASGVTCEYAGMVNNDALLRGNAQNVLDGNSFVSLLYTSINIMQYFFFAVSPVVLLLLLINPMGSQKMFMSYMLFGLWVSSLLMFAAPMSFYIQNQVVQSIAAVLDSTNGLTMSNYSQFRSTMMQNLSFASQMMAFTPVLSFGLLSGSLFALSSFAQNLEKHNDASVIQPPAFSNAAISQASPKQQLNINTGAYQNPGMSELSITESSQVSTGINSSKSSQIGTVRTQGGELKWTDSKGKESKTSWSETENFSTGLSKDISSSVSATGDAMTKMFDENSSLKQTMQNFRNANPGLAKDDIGNAMGARIVDKAISQNANFLNDYNGKTTPEKQAAAKRLAEEIGTKEFNNSTLMVGSAGATALANAADSRAGGISKKILGDLSADSQEKAGIQYGVKEGMDKSKSFALTQASQLVNAMSDSQQKQFQNGESFSTTGAALSSRTVQRTMSLSALGAMLQQDHQARDALFARSQVSDGWKTVRDRETGYRNTDTQLEAAVNQAYFEYVKGFNSTFGSGMKANANQGLENKVNKNLAKPLSVNGRDIDMNGEAAKQNANYQDKGERVKDHVADQSTPVTFTAKPKDESTPYTIDGM
jgi:hypothetical protein